MDTLKYFEVLFGGLREYTDSPLPLFGKMAKGGAFKTRHPMSPQEAATLCDELRSTHDLYSSIGLGAAGRDVELQTELQVGIAVDLDVEGPHRAKTNLFESSTEAIELVLEQPLKPSLIVNSGFGVQAYWLWKEPWVFTDNDERLQAKGMIQGWIELLRRHGRTIDSTYGINGLYRIPGTLNHKSEYPVETSILYYSEDRTDPSEFEPFIVKSTAATFLSAVTLRPEPAVSQRISFMLTTSPEFAEIWFHKKRGQHDPSQSGWDWAIASALVEAQLDDEEIANALTANRDVFGGKRKPPRYYQYTLAKIRSKTPREAVAPSPGEEAGPRPAPPDPELPQTSEMDAWYLSLSKTVGMRIALIEYDDPKHSVENIHYAVVFNSNVRVVVTKDKDIRSYRYWTTHIRGVSPIDQLPLPTLAKGDWERVIAQLRAYAVPIGDGTLSGDVTSALITFIEATVTTIEDLTTIRAFDKRTFFNEGRYYFLREEFTHWYWKIHGKIERSVLSEALLRLGAERKQLGRRGNSYVVIDEDQFGRAQEDLHRGPAPGGGPDDGDPQDHGDQAEVDPRDGRQDRLFGSTQPN